MLDVKGINKVSVDGENIEILAGKCTLKFGKSEEDVHVRLVPPGKTCLETWAMGICAVWNMNKAT